MLPFAASAPVLTVRRELVRLAQGIAEARAEVARRASPTAALSRIQASASALAAALEAGVLPPDDGANLRDWAAASMVRTVHFRRALAGLMLLARQPSVALEPVALATVQAAGDVIGAWTELVSDQIEERAQLGDAALAALAAMPLGIFRALGLGALAVVDADDLEAAKRAAAEGATGLLGEVPWWAWALLVGGLAWSFRR